MALADGSSHIMLSLEPEPELPKRVTRSSTRTKKSKDEDNTEARQSLAPKHKSSAKVRKSRKDSKAKLKDAIRVISKSNSKLKGSGDGKEEKEDHVKSPASATLSNITTLSISSDLVKKPILCHQYTPSTASTKHDRTPFIFTHGAGGTLSATAVTNFCSGFSFLSSHPILAFQGSMNLGARVKGFQACRAHVFSAATRSRDDGEKALLFGGRSMGARAAVLAASEIIGELDGKGEGSVEVKLVLVSYPLQGPKDVRDQILLDLPKGVRVLFVVGDRDAMCPLELLEKVRAKMVAKSRLVVVRGADHGMDVRPGSRTREIGEETGRVAARWLEGEIGAEGEVLYVGEEE